jgi:transmembrane sensor
MTLNGTPIDEHLASQASAWLVRLHDEAAREGDWLTFETWLTESPAHRAAYDQAELMWADLDERAAAIKARLTPLHNPRGQIARRNRGRRRPVVFVWASGLVAAALIVAMIIPSKLAETFTTAPGERRTVTLDDGSMIVMNGASTLSVRYSARSRQVIMGDAEAAFDVVHTPGRPFIVDVGQSQVTVVGTAFNIRRDASSTQVAVKRGIVQVANRLAPAVAVRLVAGRSLRQDDGSAPAVQSQIEPQAASGWQTGRVVYANQPLEFVAKDISRAFAEPVVVDASAKELTFSGVLALDDEGAVLHRLALFLPIAVHRESGHFELVHR